MNNPTKIPILSLNIDPLTISEANNAIAEFVRKPQKISAIVIKPYVEFLVAASKDLQITRELNKADLCIADGVSLQWAASFLYGQPNNKRFLKVPRSGLRWLQDPVWRAQVIPEKMAGATQTADLLRMAEKNGWKVGILGGLNSPSEIQKAIKQRFPKLNSIKTWSGFYEPSSEQSLVTDIAANKLDILFVAMGFPRQENFMFRHKHAHLAKVMIGEGGTFDYEQMGGPIRRSPIWMQKSGTEWLWRLARQPKRFRRQLAIPRFVWAVKRQSKLPRKF